MDAKTMAERWVRALNEADMKTVETLLHPDISFKSSRDIEPIEGAEAAALHYEMVLTEGAQGEIVGMIAEGGQVCSELVLTEQSLNGEVTVRNSLMLQTWVDGKLIRHRHFGGPRQIRD